MRLRGSLRDQKGGVAVMAALFGGLICVSAAFAVDLGSMVLKGREVQGAADLSALAAAQTLSQADAAARATAAANLADLSEARVQIGVYTPDAQMKPAARFSPGAAEPNAARVVLTAPAPLYFGRWILGRDSVVVSKSATAALPGGPPSAMFSIGSRLAAVDNGLANDLLSALLGSRVSLTVMDYKALADARINLLQFSDALATDLGVTAGDYDALLAHQVEAGRVLKVLKALAGNDTKGALGKLMRAPAKARLKLGELIGVEADARDGLRERLDAEVSVRDLLNASLTTANQDRQLALNVSADAVLAQTTIMLVIGERPNRSPWLTVTSHGEPVIRTTQTRLYVKTGTAKAVSGLTEIKLPILIEAAASEASLKRIDCQAEPRVTLAVRPGVARARVGKIDESHLRNFKSELTVTPAPLVSVLGLLGVKVANVTGKADIKAADLYWSDARFTAAEIDADRPKMVGSKHFAEGLVVSLLTELDLKVELLGGLLNLPISDLLGTVSGLLKPLGSVLDGLIQPLLATLGVSLGEADVWVHGVRCPNQSGIPQLVG